MSKLFRDRRGGYTPFMFRIFDNNHRRVVGNDFQTREEAEERLAELIEDDPSNEHALRILAAGQGGTRKS